MSESRTASTRQTVDSAMLRRTISVDPLRNSTEAFKTSRHECFKCISTSTADRSTLALWLESFVSSRTARVTILPQDTKVSSIASVAGPISSCSSVKRRPRRIRYSPAARRSTAQNLVAVPNLPEQEPSNAICGADSIRFAVANHAILLACSSLPSRQRRLSIKSKNEDRPSLARNAMPRSCAFAKRTMCHFDLLVSFGCSRTHCRQDGNQSSSCKSSRRKTLLTTQSRSSLSPILLLRPVFNVSCIILLSGDVISSTKG
mmetsp:Transcript_5675/g.7975  ORF Transcript_5675/g.7975 Transcript_5675/m.7975 type:complete len:260 (-) Transcript_5675:506-1285(-)